MRPDRQPADSAVGEESTRSPAPMAVAAVRPGGRRRLVGSVIVGLAFVTAALWKPWPAGTAGPRPPSPVVAAPWAAAPGPVLVGPATPSGLDLSFIGPLDTHRAWGVAAAYVPRRVLRDALVAGRSTVVPVADWTLAGAADPVTLNHPDSIAVAVAVTWPSSVRPSSVALLGVGGPRPLGDPLPALATRAGPAPAVRDAVDQVAWSAVSGAFFLPPTAPSGLAGWLGGGWPSGTYTFLVEMAGGGRILLPFRIAP